MKLLSTEKQALIGPLVVGALFGAFAAYAVFAFSSEYRLSGNQVAWWQVLLEASLAFFVCVGGSVGLLGVLPVLIHRNRSGAKPDA